MDDIASNYTRVSEQVARAAERAGRHADEVTLVCAAKTKGPAVVRAALRAGATDIGENYVQEAQHKIHTIPESAKTGISSVIFSAIRPRSPSHCFDSFIPLIASHWRRS